MASNTLPPPSGTSTPARPSASKVGARPSFFQKKELGLPVWAWVLIGVAGVGGYIVWVKLHSSSTGTAASSGTVANGAQPPLSYGSGGGGFGSGGLGPPGVGSTTTTPPLLPILQVPPNEPVPASTITPAAGATAPAPVYRTNPTGYTVPQSTVVSSSGASTPSSQTVQSEVPANFYPADWQQIGLPTPAIGTPIGNGIPGQYTLYTG